MTEEAFIRAVIDHPGQDTPRLVYADWLDDHDAPDRAAYLRAEAAWAAPWRAGARPAEPTELRSAAAELDPLWIARVSRPPLGVCCDHFVMEDSGPDLTCDDLARVEAEFGFVFPVEYAAFLLNWNGGRPYPTRSWLPTWAHFSDGYFYWFYPVATGEVRPPGCLQAQIDGYRRDQLPRLLDRTFPAALVREWYAERVPVAQTPEPGCEEVLAVQGPSYGSISWVDWSSDPPRPGVAFTAYLAEFRPPAEYEIPESAWDNAPPENHTPTAPVVETDIPF